MDGPLVVIYGHQLKSPAIAGFIDRVYRYNSVATQIPQSAGLTQIPYTRQISSSTGDRTNRFLRQLPVVRMGNCP